MSDGLYEKNIICPICNNKFTTKKVKTSAIRVSKRDTDFCPYYEGENPLFYGVFVCEHCGYAALEGGFSITKPEENKEKILNTISPKWNPRSYGGRRDIDEAIEAYKLALLCCDVLNEKSSIQGKLCLRLAWFYRYKNEKEEKKFIDFTINFFEKAYTGERISGNEDEEVIVLYLLGELNRRAEKFSKSIIWFDKTLSNPQIKRKRHIELKARDQWSLAREEYKKRKAEVV
ncbi:DUF2225 domain-containing protein [Maledivibacter halophilus]|uniref:DUF2225 domain-containing protein n=1 Tax=Maledivibacter halophilus TaxID=36842 RepID=A0A1T5LIM4_9FIRM|nr:DUF2225 domain-containing protein [Maledivibacter halophilus]SKC75827.1 hypothetical protein SAMN02194393_02903 [Maledivibacter halophilus]